MTYGIIVLLDSILPGTLQVSVPSLFLLPAEALRRPTGILSTVLYFFLITVLFLK